MQTAAPPSRLILAFLLPFLAWGLQTLLWAYVSPFVTFFFYPAIFLSSWFGGRRGGLLATVISLVLMSYFFLEPVHSFQVLPPSHRLMLLMFVLMGITFSLTLQPMQTAAARQRRSDARFRTLFAQAPLGMALIDSLSGHIYEVNPRFAEITGRTREEMAAIDWMSITHPDDIQADLDNMARLNAGDIPGFQMDKRYLKPDGTVVWIQMTIAPVSVESGESPRHLCMIEDITERRAAEQHQQRILDRLRLANDVADIGIWDWDLQSNRLEWDDRLCEWYGLTPEERQVGFQYDRWCAGVHPDDLPATETSLHQAVASGEPWDATFRIHRSDGTQRHIHAAAIVYRDDHHQPTRVLGINQDITEQQARQTALVEARAQLEQATTRQRLSALIEQRLVGVLEVAADGRIVRVNDRLAGLLGYAREELPGQTVHAITDPRDWADSELRWRELKQNGQACSFVQRYQQKTGGPVWAQVLAMPVVDSATQVQTHLALIVDIDALKRAEQNLRLAMEGSQIGMYDWDLATGTITWTGEHERLWGYGPCEFDGSYEAFARRVHPEDLDGVSERITRARTSQQPYRHILRVIWPDGSVHWINGRGEFEYDAEGQPLHMRGMVIDITDSVRTETDLREQKERLSEAQRIAHIGNWVLDLDGPITWSTETYRLFGVEPGVFIPSEPSLLGLIHPEDQAALRDWLIQCRAHQHPTPLMLRRYLPDGRLRYLRGQGELQHDHQGRPIRLVGTLQDVTEIHLVTEQLRQSQRQLMLSLEAGQLGAWHWDLSGDHLDATPVFRQIFGLPADGPLDYATILGMVHSDDLPVDWRRNRELVITQRNNRTLEYQILRPDGSQRWCRSYAMLTTSDDGTPNAMDGVVIDITDQQLASQTLERLRLLMEAGERIAHIGSWEYVVATQETVWSAEECRIYGLDPAAPSPDYAAMMQRCIHPEDAERLDQTFRAALQAGLPFELEHRIVQPDGTVRQVKDLAYPDFDAAGHLIKYVGATLDITESKQAEARLRQTDERLRLATEGGQIGIWFWDVQTDAFELTPLCQRHVALPPDTVFSYPYFLSVLHPEDRERTDQAIQTALRDHQDYAIEYRVRQDDGRYRWIEASGRGLDDAAGKAMGLIGITRDITERQLAEVNLRESEQRFRNLFEHLPIAYQSLDIQGRWLDANQKAADLLGFATPEAMLGHDFIDHWDDTLKDQFELKYDDFKRNHAIEGELLLHRTDGQPITVQIAGRIQRDADGRFQRTHCILVDVTERRAMEDQILALNADLELKVEQRTRQLAAANAAKGQFLAHMSHEIRTPMNAVLGLAQLLEDEPLTADQQQMVHRINIAGRSLLGILNDILDFSKIEAGQLRVEPRPFKLADLLTHLDSLMSAVAHGKGLTLRLQDDATIRGRLRGDALRIEQVLINLTGNALKFTEQGGVTIRVAPVSVTESAARLRFEIKDTGIGMSPEAVAQLFTPFTQADASISRRFGGTGLGLSISKRLVDLMGGDIGVESTPGVGSLFWFELPFARLADAEPPATHAAEVKGPRLSGLRLLVVDDSQINLYLAERVLQREGAEVTLKKNGQEAVDCLRDNPDAFDLVLMDIQMPVMDGLTATRAIRRELGLEKLPIIALTAGVLAEEQQNALDAGVNDFLPKPMDLHQMASLIRSYCPADV